MSKSVIHNFIGGCSLGCQTIFSCCQRLLVIVAFARHTILACLRGLDIISHSHSRLVKLLKPKDL